MRFIAVARLVAAPLLGACQPVVGHGPELAMPPTVLSDVRVEAVWSSSRWTLGERPFPEALRSEVVDGMRGCAGNGSRPVQLRLHIARRGESLGGRVEVVDARTHAVLARMPIAAAGVGEREASRQFAGEICRKAFGGNQLAGALISSSSR